MESELLKVDEKGRLHIPKKMREDLGIKPGQVKGRMQGQTLVIEPASNAFDRLSNTTKCNFASVEKSLPRLRKAAEERLVQEIERQG